MYQNNVEVHDHDYSGSLKIKKNDKQVFFKSVNKLEKVSQKVNVIISMHTGMGCMHARTLPNTTTTTTTTSTTK